MRTVECSSNSAEDAWPPQSSLSRAPSFEPMSDSRSLRVLLSGALPMQPTHACLFRRLRHGKRRCRAPFQWRDNGRSGGAIRRGEVTSEAYVAAVLEDARPHSALDAFITIKEPEVLAAAPGRRTRNGLLGRSHLCWMCPSV